MFSIIMLLWIFYSINKAAKNKPAQKQTYTLKVNTDYRQQEKLIQQQKKRKQAIEKAEKDIDFYSNQYEILYDLARQIESDITNLSKQIEIDKKMNLYDAAKKKQNRLFQLTKKQISIESQLYSIQSKINKAKFIIIA